MARALSGQPPCFWTGPATRRSRIRSRPNHARRLHHQITCSTLLLLFGGRGALLMREQQTPAAACLPTLKLHLTLFVILV